MERPQRIWAWRPPFPSALGAEPRPHLSPAFGRFPGPVGGPVVGREAVGASWKIAILLLRWAPSRGIPSFLPP